MQDLLIDIKNNAFAKVISTICSCYILNQQQKQLQVTIMPIVFDNNNKNIM